MIDEVLPKKIVSVNFSHALFYLLCTHDDLVMHALVKLRRSGLVLHTRIYDNLTYLSTKFKENPGLACK